MKTHRNAPSDDSGAASSPGNGEGLFPPWCFGGLLAECRPVWHRHWRWITATTVVVFLAALGLRRFDLPWMELSVAGEHPVLDDLARSLSWWGEFHRAPLIALGVVALGGWITRRRSAIYGALAGFLGGAGAGLVVMVSKVVFGRPRPYVHLTDGFYWFKFGHDWASFPSGHAAHSFGMAVGLSMVLPWTWPLTLLAAAAVAWSRYQLDRHYPTDLLMGMWVGVAAGLVFGLAARRCLRLHWPSAKAGPNPKDASPS
jgi:membrane-associated phospholipid phosphatase